MISDAEFLWKKGKGLCFLLSTKWQVVSGDTNAQPVSEHRFLYPLSGLIDDHPTLLISFDFKLVSNMSKFSTLHNSP